MRNSVDGVNLQQMLVAMFRANQEAFVGDNMNRLRAGKIINIPEKEAAASVSPTDARRVVVAQFADFKDYRRSLGSAVAAAPAPQESGRQVSGPITAQEKEKPTPQKGSAKDQLRLSAADDAKRGGKAAGTAVADDLAAKEKALREANERIALLEKNLQDLQKVRITHLPTGIVVQCQDERSQTQNRLKSMRILKARLYEIAQQEQQAQLAAERRSMVGSGDRSEKIRTYNFPQSRVTDHRAGLTSHRLAEILDGNLDLLLEPLIAHLQAERLERELAASG